MLKRWDIKHYDIKHFLSVIEELCPEIIRAKKQRGRPPKHPIKKYLAIVALKEENKDSLRKAESNYSEDICGERVDHSVIHYWEKKLNEVFSALIKRIGKTLLSLLSPLFFVLDSTKFSNWKHKEVEFHTLTAVTEEIYLFWQYGSQQSSRKSSGSWKR